MPGRTSLFEMSILPVLTLLMIVTLGPGRCAPSEAFLEPVRGEVSNDVVWNSTLVLHTPEDEPCVNYILMRHKKTWYAARKKCAALGMNLASIRYREEQAFMEEMIEERGLQNESIWLGGHNLLEEGEGSWVWRYGPYDEPFFYQNWAVGQPNNARGNEHCLEISSEDYNWNDANCLKRSLFVCERQKFLDCNSYFYDTRQ